MLLFSIFLPIVFCLLIPILHKLNQKLHIGYFVLACPIIIFLYFLQFVQTDLKPIFASYNWISNLAINFDLHIDGLSLLFVLLISGIGSLVVLYSIFYMDRSEKLVNFYTYLLLFMTAMLGVVLSDNIFVLYTFWELTSISSFLLIGFWHFKKASRDGALKAMSITVFGGLSLFGSLIILSTITNTTKISEMITKTDVILNSPYLPLAIIMLLIGAFTKSAQFPFHIWLPDAMEAPTPVSAYLHSATMVKAGLYLVARFAPLFSETALFVFITSLIGLITLVWGSFNAIKQIDLKAILAFSTISQLGMIMMLFGLSTKLAIFAGVLHIVNHAVFKGALFMVAGIVDMRTQTRDITKLGGLVKFMPITSFIALLAALSMAGVPLPFLNGFYSKEFILESVLNLPQFEHTFIDGFITSIPYFVVFGSIFTFVYSIYFVKNTFFGEIKTKPTIQYSKGRNIGFLISPFILSIGILLLGLLPNLLNSTLVANAANSILNVTFDYSIMFWHGFNKSFILTLIIVIIGLFLIYTLNQWKNVYTFLPERLTLNRLYSSIFDNLQPVTNKITSFYMTGSLRLYMMLILGATVIGTTITLIITNGFSINFDNLAPISILEIVIIFAMIIAAVATLFQNHHLSAILVLGIVGFGTAMLFVIYRAPDLALTQLVIETITMVLFLLTFRHLPKLRKRDEKKRTKLVHFIVSISFGAILTVVAISSHSVRYFDTISNYFVKTADTIGGGTNIVNVILVDMRGFDTLFEIAVLAIAALAIHALIRISSKKELD